MTAGDSSFGVLPLPRSYGPPIISDIGSPVSENTSRRKLDFREHHIGSLVSEKTS